MNICKGVTKSGKLCHRKVRNDAYCFQHKKMTQFSQEKPAQCAVCWESLDNQKYALECGHWIHIRCIIQSAKAVCPLCRKSIQLTGRELKSLHKIAIKRKQEDLAEEEEELQRYAEERYLLVTPDIQEQLQRYIEHVLEVEGITPDISVQFAFDEELSDDVILNIVGIVFGDEEDD